LAGQRIAASASLALLGLCAALLAGELLLRLLPSGASDALRALHEPRPDRPWLFGMRPGARARHADAGDVVYEIDAAGFRDADRERPEPAGASRILVFGDSIAFGWGVPLEASFPRRVEALIPDGWQVLNLAVNGYNPYTEAALFRDVGAAYEPDLVLVQFCINDLNDPTLHFDRQTRLHLGEIPDAAFPDPSLRREPVAPRLAGVLRLCRRSRLCARLDAALLGLGSGPGEDDLRHALVPADGFPSGTVRSWLAARYGEMAEHARSLGAPLVVVAFPHRAQLEEGASDRIQRQLAELGREGGWETLDLLPAFREAAVRPGEPLFADLWHPTARGHDVAAREIAARLAELGLLDRPRGEVRRDL
jgi:lysophospholipase L1-like esterase